MSRLAAALLLVFAATARAAPQPLVFEPQRDAAVFVTRGSAWAAQLRGDGAAIEVAPGTVVRMRILGARGDVALRGEAPRASVSNEFVGADATRWRRGIPHFGRVRASAVLPGVDVVYYGNPGRLEADFEIAPGADPAAIALGFEGGDALRVDADGALVIGTGGAELRHSRPVAYQNDGGARRDVAARWTIGADGRARFALGAYDRARPLVIDPVLSYSTYLGGTGPDSGRRIVADALGYTWVTGRTLSTDFPAVRALQANFGGGAYDAFVAKFDPQGTLLWSTYFGGSGEDRGDDLDVDAQGYLYVAGRTDSPNLPVARAFQPLIGGGTDCFLAKLLPDGSAFVYLSYLGGAGPDGARGVAADDRGRLVATGFTASHDFPLANPAPVPLRRRRLRRVGGDRFALRQPPRVLHAARRRRKRRRRERRSRRGGPSRRHRLHGLVRLPDRQRRAAGTQGRHRRLRREARSGRALDPLLDVPRRQRQRRRGRRGRRRRRPGRRRRRLRRRSHALDRLSGGRSVAGHARGDGRRLRHQARAERIAHPLLDLSRRHRQRRGARPGRGRGGLAFVAGRAGSADFPLVSPVQAGFGGLGDAFSSILAANGASLLQSTYLGGADADDAFGVAIDAADDVFVTGETISGDFPTLHAAQALRGGQQDAFVTKVLHAPEVAVRLAPASGGATGPRLTVQLRNGSLAAKTVELKLWLEGPGLSPLSLSGLTTPRITLGAGASQNLVVDQPLPASLAFPGVTVGARLLDGNSGDVISESLCKAVPCH